MAHTARDGDPGTDARGRPTTHDHRRDDATGDEYECPVRGCWWNEPGPVSAFVRGSGWNAPAPDAD